MAENEINRLIIDYFTSMDERIDKSNALLSELLELKKMQMGEIAPQTIVELKAQISNLSESITTLSQQVGVRPDITRGIEEGKYETRFRNNIILGVSRKEPFFERKGKGAVISVFFRCNTSDVRGKLVLDDRQISFDLDDMRLYEWDEPLTSSSWWYSRYDTVANIYALCLTSITLLSYQKKMYLEIENKSRANQLTIAQIRIERATY